MPPAFFGDRRIVDDCAIAKHRIERRAQFVRHIGEKRGLHLVALLGTLTHVGKQLATLVELVLCAARLAAQIRDHTLVIGIEPAEEAGTYVPEDAVPIAPAEELAVQTLEKNIERELGRM